MNGSFYTGIYKGHLECLRVLLDHRVNINQSIDNDGSPLLFSKKSDN